MKAEGDERKQQVLYITWRVAEMASKDGKQHDTGIEDPFRDLNY